jgi:tripartite-type tricarboxylate transporter receptor subunit TctC
MIRRIASAGVAVALAAYAAGAAGQAWPNRPIRMVVPLSPGGFADVPARIVAPRLSTSLGEQVYVENKPGAGGTIGAELVASGPYVLVVNPQLPVSSVPELIAAAKAQPGKIDFASSGNGSAQHLVAALFNTMAGINLNHVPYKGSGPAMQDLLSGQVKVSFAGTPNVLNHVRAGKLRALAVTTAQRWPELAEVPTVAEAGVPGYEATLWLHLAAPAGTPAEVVNRLAAETSRALQDPELVKTLRTAGVQPSVLGPQELGAFMRAEHEKWGGVVKATGATVN